MVILLKISSVPINQVCKPRYLRAASVIWGDPAVLTWAGDFFHPGERKMFMPFRFYQSPMGAWVEVKPSCQG